MTLYVFFLQNLCALIIIKSSSKLSFCLTNVRSFSSYSVFQEVNYLRITVKYPLWILNASPQGLVEKLSMSHTKSQTWQFLFSHESDLPVISTFGLFALTKWTFRLLSVWNPTTGISWKTFLYSWFGVERICNKCKTFYAFWITGS